MPLLLHKGASQPRHNTCSLCKVGLTVVYVLPCTEHTWPDLDLKHL